jgi:hypothetical protein
MRAFFHLQHEEFYVSLGRTIKVYSIEEFYVSLGRTIKVYSMEEFYVSLGRTIKVYVSPSKKIFGPVPDPSSHFFSQKIENKFSKEKLRKHPENCELFTSFLRNFAVSQLRNSFRNAYGPNLTPTNR